MNSLNLENEQMETCLTSTWIEMETEIEIDTAAARPLTMQWIGDSVTARPTSVEPCEIFSEGKLLLCAKIKPITT